MSPLGDYFFCGVGGSGMTPLALLVQARGGRVEGSDRALDQGRNAAKFDFLRTCGVRLYPQDASGKSTTTGMLGWILQRAGKDPTIVNGGEMKNFPCAGSTFASTRAGEGGD